MRVFLILSLAILSACTMAKEITLPDGKQGYNISCNGTANSFSSCVEKAGEVCGSRGYEVIGQNGEKIPYVNSSGSAFGGAGGFSGGYQTQMGMFVNRNLFVRCK
ncbi:MAG: hypothetical protein GC136_07620 [Alphaproteobacteria bacterium]|nr:hypothetical protein [Alphaproteobacteria bacterium]